MIEIKVLDKDLFKGYHLKFEYDSLAYYKVSVLDYGFKLDLIKRKQAKVISFEDYLVKEHLEDSIILGAYINEKLVGVVEASIESWNNRFRVYNILVEKEFRNLSVGSKLLLKLIEIAKVKKCRMVVLETQTCNVNAINFYQKHGFQIIGLDLFAYSNQDVNENGVRLEMGLIV